MVAFIVVPQWQGSPSSRAMRLADGAAAIRDDLPVSATRTIDVPLESGDTHGTGIARYGSLRAVRERLGEQLRHADGPVIVIGGDCGVTAGAVEHVAGDDLALVWLDAHPDLNTPASSPSGAYAGMVLASIVDDGLVAGDRVVLAGARQWDDAEQQHATDRGVTTVTVEELADADALVRAVEATGAARVYVHIDLDVLDPAEFAGLLAPIPFGASLAQLVAAVRALVARFGLAGATIASFAPESADAALDDSPAILRLIAALRG